MTTSTQLVLFGPQQVRWTQARLYTLQADLQKDASFDFLRRFLEQLEAFLATTPLAPNDVTHSAGSLAAFARGEDIPQPETLSNTHLAVLTIVSQAIDWLRLVAEHGVASIVVQGFCVGFLSAAAISSTHNSNQSEFELYMSRAVRLAACIGLLVDAEDATHPPPDRATVISIRCQYFSDRTVLEAILDSFPHAYISCVTDDRTLTVTLPHSQVARLTEHLQRESIPTTAIGLNGSYHHSKHAGVAQRLKDLCACTPDLQLPPAELLRLPLRSTANTELLTSGALHDIAIDLVLCKRAHWFQTIKRTLKELPSHVQLRSVGHESHIPRSLSVPKAVPSGTSDLHPHKEIAVVGMACRFPQADTLDEFWQLISSGGTAIATLPSSRFDPTHLWREPKLPTFWGNFLRHADSFDHRFFGISGREAKSMDPQQRLALQVAYEAIETAGYYRSPNPETDVGCYLGVGSVDYEGNVASENANAFSATGTLRAFIAGRISHFFGWTGSSQTIDTACSSSAVAISTACKALLAGDCAMAIAGGVNVIANPNLHQNLAAASFLNPSGSSCAFDASAGGYCRGEGAGIVVLKPLSKAIAAGDNILAVISGSAVNQGSNLSPITVPDSQSQSTLYKRALSSAQIDPKNVQYVEAHGTGTQVGDPIEYESIRLALAGDDREETLFLGSVKDNIGHTEAASGAAGIIKIILMIQRKTIPKQANFTTLNPRIKASNSIRVPETTQPWTASRPVALLNNYGASGNNAAIVLRGFAHTPCAIPDLTTYPIVVSAKTFASLKAYLDEIKRFMLTVDTPLKDIAYTLMQRQNPSFEYRAALTAGTTASLISILERANTNIDTIITHNSTQPVVLVFGGQTGRTVTVSKDIYVTSQVLRRHLDECEAVCQDLGLPSMLSDIFSGQPVNDLVQLHCMLLSMQISYAKSWIDCGLQVDTLIGHSFGQISALCVANSISLRDAFRLISGRARLIRDKWGSDHGSMLSIECDLADVKSLVNRANLQGSHRVDVACYNGPRNFVLAGDTPSIEWFEGEGHSFKMKRLQNTHAYHSYVADGILGNFKDIAQSITVRSPDIHVETCSRDTSWPSVSALAIAEHTRKPVYFAEAVQRVADRLKSAVWLEAGSETPVISMARLVLAQSEHTQTFIPMDLGGTNAISNLANTTCQLWTAGVRLQIPFWPFHGLGHAEQVDLPPYQFERTQHWIQYKPDLKHTMHPIRTSTSSLVTILEDGGQDGEYTFNVDTSVPVFDLATCGHAVAGQSLCPASMYIEMVTQSAMILMGSTSDTHLSPYVEDLVMSAPLGLGADLFLQLRTVAPRIWSFIIFSKSSSNRLEHGRGRISLPESKDIIAETRLRLLQKMAPSSSMNRIMHSPTATSISGAIVYQLFSDVVDYAAYYRGVKLVSALSNEAVGLVDLSQNSQPFNKNSTVCKPIELDNFLQIAGIHVNCLSPRRSNEVFMCTAVNELILAPSFMVAKTTTQKWEVYSRHETGPDGNLTNNIFIYDPSKTLVAAVMGAIFRSVPLKSLARSLNRLNQLGSSVPVTHKDDMEHLVDSGYQSHLSTPSNDVDQASVQHESPVGDSLTQIYQPSEGADNMLQRLRDLLSNIIEVPVEEIVLSSSLDELGIDSLLVTEVLWEIQKHLKIHITQVQFQSCTDVLSLCQLLKPQGKLKVTPRLTPTSTPDETAMAPKRDVVVSEEPYNLAFVTQECFSELKQSYDGYAERTGFSGFYAGPFLIQSQLVVQYVIDAFQALGCAFQRFSAGDIVPIIPHVEAQQKLIPQLYMILEDARLIVRNKDGAFQRTATPMPSSAVSSLHSTLLHRFPQHTSEMKLLYTTGHRLADCLSGSADPISLIFQDSSARALLEDVYTNAPMFKAGTLLLAEYLSSIVTRLGSNCEIRILELGAGTGGTTKEIVSTLAKLSSNSAFTYTFTDLSSSLVAAARRKFSQCSFMRYAVLDIEEAPGPELLGHYDIIISTNCIHATKNLTTSTTHIRQMLRLDGILCLVELTRNLFWFDLVFGLLSGWWLFNDGRSHVLADEQRWERSLREAGFNWIDWSNGASKESDLLRVITASPSKALITPVQKETMAFKNVDGLELEADLYYPAQVFQSTTPLPVALMIHGGGHVMLSRDDIRPDQTQLLLQHGFLPISVDYRLCPEVTLIDGPMADVVDALHWIRTVLPSVPLSRRDIKVDGSRVVSVGWSTGGTLALSLGWTSIERGIKPPEAILVFYCPLDYEDDFWLRPNIPRGSESTTNHELDESIWDAVSEKPITRWKVPPSKRALGGWMAPSDPRSRLALFMNWNGQTLQVLLRGLDKHAKEPSETPTAAEIEAVSPLAQVRRGSYYTPTFIIHPREDDLIPWKQAQRIDEALRKHGIESQLRVVDGVPHLFDMYREHQKREEVQEVIHQGYVFLLSHVR